MNCLPLVLHEYCARVLCTCVVSVWSRFRQVCHQAREGEEGDVERRSVKL
uniref:Uncharacterized protein n=1 Tax=Anguilla anguilla TaxID=7936 RepID=A0A0E9RV05_ANGAN